MSEKEKKKKIRKEMSFTNGQKKAKELVKRELYLALAIGGLLIAIISMWSYANDQISALLYFLGIGIGSLAIAFGECVYLARSFAYKKLPLFIIGGFLLFFVLFYCLTIFVFMLVSML